MAGIKKKFFCAGYWNRHGLKPGEKAFHGELGRVGGDIMRVLLVFRTFSVCTNSDLINMIG